jgi:hypothetical protein
MWDLALGFYDRRGQSLEVQQVLDDEERVNYVIDIQNATIVQTTTNARTYSSGTYVTPERDAALVTAIEDQHSCDVDIISSREGLDQIPIDTDSRKTAKYGNLLGSNDLGEVGVGVILGSPHYGDPYIERWSALAGSAWKQMGKRGWTSHTGSSEIRSSITCESTMSSKLCLDLLGKAIRRPSTSIRLLFPIGCRLRLGQRRSRSSPGQMDSTRSYRRSNDIVRPERRPSQMKLVYPPNTSANFSIDCVTRTLS